MPLNPRICHIHYVGKNSNECRQLRTKAINNPDGDHLVIFGRSSLPTGGSTPVGSVYRDAMLAEISDLVAEFAKSSQIVPNFEATDMPGLKAAADAMLLRHCMGNPLERDYEFKLEFADPMPAYLSDSSCFAPDVSHGRIKDVLSEFTGDMQIRDGCAFSIKIIDYGSQ